MRNARPLPSLQIQFLRRGKNSQGALYMESAPHKRSLWGRTGRFFCFVLFLWPQVEQGDLGVSYLGRGLGCREIVPKLSISIRNKEYSRERDREKERKGA